MKTLRQIGLVLCALAFGPLLILSVLSYGFNKTLGDQDYTKQAIVEAGFYEAVGETIQSEAVGQETPDPLINAALQSAVSGANLQTALEPLIDSVYSWLEGESEQPEFNLAIEPVRTNFQTNLTTALEARAASLPVCPGPVPTSGTDIFTYNCIPAGTDVNQTIANAVESVTSTASVFTDEVVADDSISSQEAAELGLKDPTANLPEALPNTYQFLANGQWWFVAGTLLTGLGVVFLSRTWLHGLRKLGILLVINGLGLLAFGFALGYLASSVVPSTTVEATERAVNAIGQASQTILGAVANINKLAGLVAGVLGVISLVVSALLLRKQAPATELGANPSKPENPTPTSNQPKQTSK